MEEQKDIQPVEELKVKPVPGKQRVAHAPLGIKIVEIILIVNAALIAFNVIIRLNESGIWMLEQIILGAISVLLVWGIRRRAPWSLYGVILIAAYGILSPIFLSQTIFIFSLLIDMIILYLVLKNRGYFATEK